MREIMFKGKSTENNEWVYGYMAQIGNTVYIISPENTNKTLFTPVGLDTICEYTEFNDDLGNDLYEGDIVEVTFTDMDMDGSKDIITSIGVIQNIGGGFDAIRHGGIRLGIFEQRWYDKLMKIGNIFDNPELMREV